MPTASNQGINIFYKLIGTGKPLVLYHGLGDSSQGWSEFGYLPDLARHRKLVLIDGRGHGRSDKPHDRNAYQPEHLANDVLCVTRDLGLQHFDYLGCSMGGWVGFALAALKPQCLSALIVNGAHPFAQNLSFLRSTLAQGLNAWAQLVSAQSGLHPVNTERILNNDIQALQALIAEDRPDISHALGHLNCPTLYLTGEYDPARAQIEAAAARSRHGVLLELSGCNHFSAITNSARSLPLIIRFLASLQEAPTYEENI